MRAKNEQHFRDHHAIEHLKLDVEDKMMKCTREMTKHEKTKDRLDGVAYEKNLL